MYDRQAAVAIYPLLLLLLEKHGAPEIDTRRSLYFVHTKRNHGPSAFFWKPNNQGYMRYGPRERYGADQVIPYGTVQHGIV